MSMTPYETACARYGQIAIDRMLSAMVEPEAKDTFPKLELFSPFLAQYGLTVKAIRGDRRNKKIYMIRKVLMNWYWENYFLTKKAQSGQIGIEFDKHRTDLNHASASHRDLLFTKDAEYTRLVQNFDKFVSTINLTSQTTEQ